MTVKYEAKPIAWYRAKCEGGETREPDVKIYSPAPRLLTPAIPKGRHYKGRHYLKSVAITQSQ